MKKYIVEIALGLVLLGVFLGVSAWQSTSTLKKAEIDHYVAIMEKSIPVEWEERNEFIARMRTWGENDDGQPVYMLNVMRLFEQNKPFPGGPTTGTPGEANDYYEKVVTPLLLKSGAYPLVSGETTRIRPGQKVSNLIVHEAPLDNWDRVLVVRYPGRRSFFNLVTNSEYLKVMPYKLASLQVVLTPLRGELMIPELRWIAGGVCCAIFLLVGWVRAVLRNRKIGVGTP